MINMKLFFVFNPFCREENRVNVAMVLGWISYIRCGGLAEVKTSRRGS